MSADVRQALADAVNPVLGEPGEARVTPYYRQTTTPGWGWVSLGARTRDDTGFGYLNRWEIRVVLSQDVAAAEQYLDEHGDALVAAVEEHMVVTSLLPAVLNLDAKTTVNALIIEGVREH